MIKSLLTLLLLSFTLSVFAQNSDIRITRVYSENYCIGNELTMDVAITGTFPADNKFTVVVTKNSDGIQHKLEYPAELRGSKLVTILQDPDLARAENFGIRIVTSSPSTESSSHYIKALTKSAVSLTTRWGIWADTLNSTDLIDLTLTTSPPSSGTVTLNNGDKFELHYNTQSWSSNYTSITLPKTKAGNYFIKEASNACGPMDVSGQVAIQVNSFDFVPVALSSDRPCEGGELKVSFNTSNEDFDRNTKFKIRFASDNVYVDSYKYVDVPAELTGKNQLTARFSVGNNQGFLNQGVYIGIVTENPSGVAINKDLKVYIYPKPSFNLKPGKSTVDLGESISISASPVGMPPYKITLTTGEVFSYNIVVSPQKTTQYQVQTFESGCGVIENPTQNAPTVAVKPGVFLRGDDSPNAIRTYCEGQTIRLAYSALGVNGQTSYVLEGVTNTSEKYLFPATVVEDSLEFYIPKNTLRDPKRDYGDIYGLRIVSANPSFTSPNFYLRIQSEPYMVWAENSQKSVPFPSAIRMDYDLRGGGPYVAKMTDGTSQTYDYNNVWYYQFISRDTTFKLASLANKCFTNETLTSFPLDVVNELDTTPALFARIIKRDYCVGDSVEVELSYNGKFEAGNKFELAFTGFGNQEIYPVPGLMKHGIYKVKLPERLERYDASLVFSSSLPRLVSETDRIYMDVKPQAPYLSPSAQKEYPTRMFMGDFPFVTIYSKANSKVSYSMDDKTGTINTDQNGMVNFPLELINNKVSEFKVKSVTNFCGSYNGENAAYFYGIGYKIVFDREVMGSTVRCVGTASELRFNIENGMADRATKFILQISSSGSSGSYSDLATITVGRMFKFVTPDVKAGSYYLRIKSSDDIYSESGYMQIGHAPQVTLHVGGVPVSRDTTVFVDYGSKLNLTTYTNTDAAWGAVFSDGEVKRETHSSSMYYGPEITSSQTFTVNKVWNVCGYGSATGAVTVKVNPIISIRNYPEKADAVICAGQKLQIDYELKGGELPPNAYIIFSLLGDKKGAIKLDSVNRLNGRVELKIPLDISGLSFVIKAELATYKIAAQLGYQLYSSPDMTISGNNTITAGESTTLLVRANKAFAYNTTFELSDGTMHTHQAGYPGGITEIKVRPTVTTTYTLTAPQSSCGAGKVSGSAVVTVQPKLSQWTTVYDISGLHKSNFCNSDTLRIYFSVSGDQSPIPGYEVLLSDSTGGNFTTIPTMGTSSPVMAIIPAEIAT